MLTDLIETKSEDDPLWVRFLGIGAPADQYLMEGWDRGEALIPTHACPNDGARLAASSDKGTRYAY
jgi:hypothetical protein